MMTVHRIEPLLVVYGRGTRAEDVAQDVIAHSCADRGLDATVLPIDEIGQVTLVFYRALIVVLPSEVPKDLIGELRPFMRLIDDYRARRPHGLRSLWEGSCEWFAVGVVQVCGLRAIMQNPRVQALLNRATVCARHYIDEFDPPVDVFKPYCYRSSTVSDPDSGPNDNVRRESIRSACRTIRKWGVTDMQMVPRLRQCIDKCRDHYENPRFPQLRRPDPRFDRNRLDIILDGPHDLVVGDRKTWMENGARVCRYVREQLQREVPELDQPCTRGAQEQLRDLYQALRIVERAMEDPDGLGFPG
jgi:hypothetical protein